MLDLQLKHSELFPSENSSQNIYSQNLKKQSQRKIKVNSTTYFSSFSNFKILHLLIKSFVIPTPNKVFGALKKSFLKKQLEKLEKLEQLEKLENRPNSNTTDYHTHQKTTKCS